MRILHTSDWHLGQHFYGKSRLAEHQAFIAWLVATVEQQNIDVVLLCGDVFDTSSPPSYARSLLNDCIIQLHKLQCQFFIMAGNHDSVAMLNESKQLVQLLSSNIISRVAADVSEQLYPLTDAQGEVQAIFCAVPFIRAKDIINSQANDNAEQKQHKLQLAIAEHYQQLYQAATAYKQQNNCQHAAIIASGHLTTVGAKTTDSVREIYIGSLSAFPASQFPAFDYLALGHIHKTQKIKATQAILYSGSPIPLSFDEAKQDKHCIVIDINQGKVQTNLLVIPRFQAIEQLRCNLEQLPSCLEQLTHNQPDHNIWLSLELALTTADIDITETVNDLISTYSVELLQLKKMSSQKGDQQLVAEQQSLEQLSIFQVFEAKLQQTLQSNQPQSESAQKAEQLTLLFQQLVEQMQQSECE